MNYCWAKIYHPSICMAGTREAPNHRRRELAKHRQPREGHREPAGRVCTGGWRQMVWGRALQVPEGLPKQCRAGGSGTSPGISAGVGSRLDSGALTHVFTLGWSSPALWCGAALLLQPGTLCGCFPPSWQIPSLSCQTHVLFSIFRAFFPLRGEAEAKTLSQNVLCSQSPPHLC